MFDTSIQPIGFSVKEKNETPLTVLGENYKYLLSVIYTNKPTRNIESCYFKMFIWEIPENEINVDIDSLLNSNYYPLYSSFVMDNCLDCKDILSEISTEFKITDTIYQGNVEKSNCLENALKIINNNLSNHLP